MGFRLFLEMGKVRLPKLWYHGTNEELWPSIQKMGLRNPYLTDVFEIAHEYAAATPGSGLPIVVSLEWTNTSSFAVDRASLQEPLGYGGFTGKQMDAKVDRLYRGRKEIRDDEWELTFPVTRTVRCKTLIPPQAIRGMKRVTWETQEYGR